MKQLNALLKYIFSFFKSEWKFEDYPLETWKNPNAGQYDLKYGAGFTNWSAFVSHGETESQAIENLKENFLEYKNNNKLQRPGKKVPLQFAEAIEIEKYETIAVDFFEKVLEMDYYSCFISDQSSLYHFGMETDEAIAIVKKHYNIEPKEDLILVNIFKQIKDASA